MAVSFYDGCQLAVFYMIGHIRCMLCNLSIYLPLLYSAIRQSIYHLHALGSINLPTSCMVSNQSSTYQLCASRFINLSPNCHTAISGKVDEVCIYVQVQLYVCFISFSLFVYSSIYRYIYFGPGVYCFIFVYKKEMSNLESRTSFLLLCLVCRDFCSILTARQKIPNC